MSQGKEMKANPPRSLDYARRDGQILWQASRYIGCGPEMSDNVAEYSGIITALEYLIEKGLAHLPAILRGDSMLSVRQMTGEWRVKGGLYLPYYRRAKELGRQFSNLTFQEKIRKECAGVPAPVRRTLWQNFYRQAREELEREVY